MRGKFLFCKVNGVYEVNGIYKVKEVYEVNRVKIFVLRVKLLS